MLHALDFSRADFAHYISQVAKEKRGCWEISHAIVPLLMQVALRIRVMLVDFEVAALAVKDLICALADYVLL